MDNFIIYSDCPQVKAAFEIAGKKEPVTLEMSLTRSIYPNGRCCRTIQPELASEYPLYELTLKQTGFRMFLYDNRHFSILRQSFVEFEGEHLENKKLLELEGDHLPNKKEEVSGYLGGGGFEKYRVQFTEESHLEGDPSFECRDYALPSDYDQCLEGEYVGQTLRLLNCTPPWLTDRQDLWCQDRLNLSAELAHQIDLHFDKILDGKAPTGNCFKPCTFIR